MTYRLNWVTSPLQVEIEQACGVEIDRCYECGKCTGGCSTGHMLDFTPRKIVQLIRLGAEELLLRIDTLSLCVSCQLCVDRCPSGIDLPRIIDYLRQKAAQQGIAPQRGKVYLFNKLFLEFIKRRGRISELLLMSSFKLNTGEYTKDAALGWKLFLKGKLRLFAPKVKGVENMRRIFSKQGKF